MKKILRQILIDRAASGQHVRIELHMTDLTKLRYLVISASQEQAPQGWIRLLSDLRHGAGQEFHGPLVPKSQKLPPFLKNDRRWALQLCDRTGRLSRQLNLLSKRMDNL